MQKELVGVSDKCADITKSLLVAVEEIERARPPAYDSQSEASSDVSSMMMVMEGKDDAAESRGHHTPRPSVEQDPFCLLTVADTASDDPTGGWIVEDLP